ncbi:MAG: metallophosphoesterase [Candidatus Tectimicrobiota bacterium]
MTASEQQLRILHLSDLHERGPREAESWRRRRVLGPAWEQNLAEVQQDGPIDLVCCTGDVADWGQAQEYEAATPFFEALLQRLHLSPDRLFVVPGNHDMARPVARDIWQRVRAHLGQGVNSQDVSRWLAGLTEPPPGLENAWREQLLQRQTAYRHWVHHSLGRPELDPSRSPHGTLGYRASIRLPGLPCPVHLLGLDTSWLAGDDADAGRLRLTEDQLMRLATDQEGRPLDGVRLALMHHPFYELADGADCRRLLAGHVDLVLRGHLHATELETWADPDRQVRQLAAGCLYEGHRADQYPNACHVLTLTLHADGQVLRTAVRFRAWSARGGHWHDDDSLYRGSRQGRLVWSTPSSRPPPAMTNPYDPWTPASPAQFVGRQGLLRGLEMALEERRSVSLVGDWRIGKSSVLQCWHQHVRERGRDVRQVSGEGPEGVSPGTLVQAITGRPAPDDPDGAADVLAYWAEGAGAAALPPVLLLDEMDGMLPRFAPRFFERLRALLGRVVLVLASRRECDRICQEVGRTSPFHNRLELHWLGLLEPEAAEALIQRGATWWSAGDEARLRHWAGRHPFYLQLVGRRLVEARQHGESADRAIERFQTEAAARFRELWRWLDAREQQALRDGLRGHTIRRRSLRDRGLVNEDGTIFGEVLQAWLREEA